MLDLDPESIKPDPKLKHRLAERSKSPEVPLYFPLSTCQQSSSIGRARSCEIPAPDFCNNYEIRLSACDPKKFPESNPAIYLKADPDAGFAVVTTFENKYIIFLLSALKR